ncbi:unnamed protein product [Adineta steineri]|uniref:NADPH oxidase n=1 Tax=Adineta steineri TaxID=433720 RepID=A0A815NI00_9BILA|nr:unnamed protein product [Adineta steineri]CAF4075534.1 unnamed protein product [Adineta steineri]
MSSEHETTITMEQSSLEISTNDIHLNVQVDNQLRVMSNHVTSPSDSIFDEINLPISVDVSIPSRRELIQVQLEALLNNPEQSSSSSSYIHEANIISLENLSKKLNTPHFIVERILNILGFLSLNEDVLSISQYNVIRLTQILNSTTDVRILLFFMILDINNDNHISKIEMNDFFKLYFQNLSFNTHNLEEAIETFLKRFHFDTQNEINFEEFYSIIIEDETILRIFSLFSIRSTRSLLPEIKSHENFIHQYFPRFYSYIALLNVHQMTLVYNYLQDNIPQIILFIIYFLINLALSLYVIIFRSTILKNNVCIIFARVCGMLLNLNCSLILILTLKQTILIIRSKRFLRYWIPVDIHIDFHKFIGRFISILAIIHTIAHMINFGYVQEYSWSILMFTTTPHIGWVGGFATLSGIILSIVLAIIIIFSMNWVRRKGYFQIFYWSHRFYLIFFVFLIIHAENSWKWIIGPFIWFSLEKIYSNIKRYSTHTGRTYLNCVTIEQSNVISLNIHKPKNFIFKPGDYIKINMPQIAPYEFHPFTISNAPEDNSLRLHIQINGNWTKKVYERYKNMSDNDDISETHIRIYRADLNPKRACIEERSYENTIENEINTTTMNDLNNLSLKKEIIIIDGPYSSCARYIFDCEHAILIAGGIGVTPYASILSSLMAQFRASRMNCSHCQNTIHSKKILLDNYRLRKVDFIWISRDHKSFEWFFKLLYEFEKEQDIYLKSHPTEKRFLTVHLYLTELKIDKNIGHHPLQLITEVWTQVTGHDIFTGLKSKTHIGRPEWDKVFNQFYLEHNSSMINNVGIFFCGPTTMNKTIQTMCNRYRFNFYKENF